MLAPHPHHRAGSAGAQAAGVWAALSRADLLPGAWTVRTREDICVLHMPQLGGAGEEHASKGAPLLPPAHPQFSLLPLHLSHLGTRPSCQRKAFKRSPAIEF